jgi:hypothetical protein
MCKLLQKKQTIVIQDNAKNLRHWPVDTDVGAVAVVLPALVDILAGAQVRGQAEPLVAAAAWFSCR